MPFRITKVDIANGEVADAAMTSAVYGNRMRAWEAAADHAMEGTAWGVSNERSFTWTREQDSEKRFYVHEDGEQPAVELDAYREAYVPSLWQQTARKA